MGGTRRQRLPRRPRARLRRGRTPRRTRPLKPADADPSARVVAFVLELRAGEVVAYGEVGRATGVGAREVGRILAGRGEECPWWRVVGAGGRILTHRRDAAMGEEQLARLVAEGVETIGPLRVRISPPA